jgi:hypothetical protein
MANNVPFAFVAPYHPDSFCLLHTLSFCHLPHFPQHYAKRGFNFTVKYGTFDQPRISHHIIVMSEGLEEG